MENLNKSYLSECSDPNRIITAIDSSLRFPEILGVLKTKYEDAIDLFIQLINTESSTEAILRRIRSDEFKSDTRMSLLKMFRRCVSPILDTETTKKIKKISTDSLIENYGHTFKPISILRKQFNSLDAGSIAALAALIGEYDTRGQIGYQLTDIFFNWFESTFSDSLSIEGPRGAGRDIELSTVFNDFTGLFPCDFIIRDKSDLKVLAIGFARYDSTRGGAQSDDRTGGNSYKVEQAIQYAKMTGNSFKIIFLSDGPGLAHKDTWEEACHLDGKWGGNVRVTTLKIAHDRITKEWLYS
jgi:hypothetical protein